MTHQYCRQHLKSGARSDVMLATAQAVCRLALIVSPLSQAIVDAVVDLIDTPAFGAYKVGGSVPDTHPHASSVAVSFVATQLAAGRATAKPEVSPCSDTYSAA